MRRFLPIRLASLTLALTVHYANGTEGDGKSNSHPFSEEQKNWWAVQPLRTEKVDGPGNPIDFFVKRKLKGENLSLAKEAGPYEFIRRASYDLWGLPPKPEEVEVFVQSFEKDPLRAKVELVDRLLADSAYGVGLGVFHELGVFFFQNR